MLSCCHPGCWGLGSHGYGNPTRRTTKLLTSSSWLSVWPLLGQDHDAPRRLTSRTCSAAAFFYRFLGAVDRNTIHLVYGIGVADALRSPADTCRTEKNPCPFT